MVRAFAAAALASASFSSAGAALAQDVPAAQSVPAAQDTPAPMNNNIGLKTMRLRLINHTNHGGNLFLYVVGQVPSQGGKNYYLANRNGNVQPVPVLSTPTSLALNLGKGETTDVQLPQMSAMRIYVSLGKALVVTSGAVGGAPSTPSGWTKGEDNKNFDTLFDWGEFTWVDNAPSAPFASTIGGNVTQVDMFGLGIRVALRGKDDSGTVRTVASGFNDVRKQIFANFKNAGAPWSRLVMGPNRTIPLRIISPYHGMALGVFPKNFQQAYINEVFRTYVSDRKAIVGTVSGRTYRGFVVNNELVFKQADGANTFKFAKPTTDDVFQNNMPPIPNPAGPSGDDGRAIGSLLGGALVRTTLLERANLNACKVDEFYKKTPVNKYGKIFHKHAIRHLAYSFGYDDTCEQSSYIQINDPASMTMTLQSVK